MKDKKTKKNITNEIKKTLKNPLKKALSLILITLTVLVLVTVFFYINNLKKELSKKEVAINKLLEGEERMLIETNNIKNNTSSQELLRTKEINRELKATIRALEFGCDKDIVNKDKLPLRNHQLTGKKDVRLLTFSYPTNWIRSELMDGGHGFHYNFFDIKDNSSVCTSLDDSGGFSCNIKNTVAFLSLFEENLRFDPFSYYNETSFRKVSISGTEAYIITGKRKESNDSMETEGEKMSLLFIENIGKQNLALSFEMRTETKEEKELFDLFVGKIKFE